MKLCICLSLGLTIVYVFGLSYGSVISDLIDFKDDPLHLQDHSKEEDAELALRSRKKRVATATILSLVSTGIAAGTSLIGTTTSALQAQTGYVVTVGVEMENYSKWLLADPRATNWWGQIAVPPTAVKPRTKETMIGHKTGHTATGTSGVVSWTFLKGGRPYRVIVMWSVPYNHDHYRNWLGVGIQPDSPTDPAFNDMYYRSAPWFVKRKFANNVNTIKYCNYGVCVSGSMGTTHKPRVIVRFIPQSIDDLAVGLRDMIDNSG